MKILFFINGIYLGGKERRLVELMKELQLRRQFEFELVVMDAQINYQQIIEMKIKVHYAIRKSKKDFSVLSQLFSICKKFKPDIIHCWDGMTAVYSIPLCKLLHIKLMNGMIANCPSKNNNILNERIIRGKISFPFSDMIVGNSKAGIKAYGAPPRKSIVIYNGYNFNRSKNLLDKNLLRHQLNIKTQYILGMVATFSKSKDYPTYFKAANALLRKRKDITFLAIGNKTDDLELQKLPEPKFIDHFRFLGKITAIESYINLLDIGVLATFTEGISNSIMEYMALGKPVIATDGGGTNEIVKNNNTGFLIKVSDSEDLADKIEFLLENPEKAIDMGIKGQERIKKYFSIDGMVEKYVVAYNNLCNHNINQKINSYLISN